MPRYYCVALSTAIAGQPHRRPEFVSETRMPPATRGTLENRSFAARRVAASSVLEWPETRLETDRHTSAPDFSGPFRAFQQSKREALTLGSPASLRRHFSGINSTP